MKHTIPSSNPIFWTDDNAEKLGLLHNLVSTVSKLNESSSFIESVQECIKISNQLMEDTGLRPPFLIQLEDQCINEQREYLKSKNENL